MHYASLGISLGIYNIVTAAMADDNANAVFFLVVGSVLLFIGLDRLKAAWKKGA